MDLSACEERNQVQWFRIYFLKTIKGISHMLV